MSILKQKFTQILILLIVALSTVSSMEVIAQSSANYDLIFDVLNQAGKSSQSNNFMIKDCLGQPSAVGNSASSIYGLSAGYLATPAGYESLVMSFSPGWSWLSFNVQPPDLAIEQVMADVANLVIMVNGAGQFYIPRVINNIGDLDVRQGYKVYFGAASQLALQGIRVSSSTPIPLNVGWNFVAYLLTSPMKSETALAAILSELVIAKDDAGNFFVPGVINTLGNMAPKKGYKLYMKKAATLVYP